MANSTENRKRAEASFQKLEKKVQPMSQYEADARGEQHAHEWIDFELLLRGLNELGARPLLLSIPIDGRYFEQFGVERGFRDLQLRFFQAKPQEGFHAYFFARKP